jgi:endonuclease/exonuclease/phosphatase (EEP) superfamily protein YafD
MYTALLIATGIVVVSTLLPILRHEAWWVRCFDFPRLQLCSLLVILLLLELVALNRGELVTMVLPAVVFACLVYQAWWIVPYSPLFPVEVKLAKDRNSRARIRIIVANVLTSNRNAEQLLHMVRSFDPDILVTLESNVWWQQRLDVLEENYPFTIKCPSENLYGMHVYSRFELQKSQIKYLVAPHIPSMHALVVLPSGDKVRLHFLHPEPPSPQHKSDSSERDAELVVVAKNVACTDTPTIVTGDLNDVAWSRTTRLFRKISGLLDPRVGRGMFNTFHADYWFFRWPLDHLFHSNHFTLVEIRRLMRFGSDHFPLLAELVLERRMRDQQEGLTVDSEDIEMAEEKAQEENVSEQDVPEPDRK